MASSVLAKLAVLISGDTAGLNQSLGNSTKALKGFQNSANAAAKQLTAVLAGVSFAAIGREIINITSEFQKFEAVLTNTLGSKSEAQEALERIRDFAAKTPFSVAELTQSFVKLANQGFEPTADEMRKLGDLASSTGKSFDQLTEAIIDAQTGEFERLKEFGIRASKSGDQVKFTFKGVETQTKFTSAAIQEYLLGLGDLEGVSGSMAAISNTLGGSISNLGDSFDNLLLTLGSLTSGPLKDFIDLMQESIKVLADDIAGKTGLSTRQQQINEQYVESAKSLEEITTNIEKLTRLQKTERQEYDSVTSSLGNLNEQVSLSSKEYVDLVAKQSTAKDFANAYGSAIEALTAKMQKLNEQTKVQAVALIPALNAEIKRFEELKNQSFSEEEIGRFNVKIRELRDELELLNARGGESNFLKNLEKGLPTGEVPKDTAPENLFPTSVPEIDTQPYTDALLTMARAADDFNTADEVRINQQIARQDALIAKQQDLANMGAMTGEIIGQAFGEAASGQISFAQAVKRTTGELVKMFLQRALAGIIASAATSGGPPPVAIALAAAGVAAISAMFSKIGASKSGGGGGANLGRSAAGNTEKLGPTGGEERIMFGEFVMRGNDLVAVVDSTNKQNGRLRG